MAAAAANLSNALSWVMPCRVSAIASAPPVSTAAAARYALRRYHGRRVLAAVCMRSGVWSGVWSVGVIKVAG